LEWHLVVWTVWNPAGKFLFRFFFLYNCNIYLFYLKSSDSESLAVNGSASPRRPPLQWNWEIEHADRKKERKADAALHGATPFEVDRRVLKDIVREKMGVDVGLITFLSAGEYSAYHIAGIDCP
jgi:hypothetical protein